MSVTGPMGDTILITIDGVEREIFMSFGLLNDLTSRIKDPALLSTLSLNSDLKDQVFKSVLAERKKSGKIVTAVTDLDDLDISISDAESILDWVSEHVMSFFLRSMQKVATLTKNNQAAMEALVSFSGGSLDSASKTASSGALTPAPAA